MKKITATILATALGVACVPALAGCTNGKVKFTLSEEGGKHYIVSFSGLSSPSGEYEIPAYYDDIPVTEIAAEGFANTNYSKITVPETVTKIGNAAFSYCTRLKTVEFAQDIKLEKFSHGMFGESTRLAQISIPDSVTSIDNYAFVGCTNLSSVTMNCVETIGINAFSLCSSLEEISLPSTLTTIGELAFYNSGLKSVEIPDSVTDSVTTDKDGNKSTVYGLGLSSFNSCLSLESVRIGNGVKIIPSGAFGYCIALKEIYLPSSLEEVQGVYKDANGSFVYGHAFYYCTDLTDVYYDGSEEGWKKIKISTDNLYESGVTMDNSALMNAAKHFNS